MLITKFNKMIRNKFIWGFIAIIISVFFVLSFSSMRGCSSALPDTAGHLYGEEVSQGALRTARYFELGLQSDRGLDREAFDELRRRTWKRLAVLRMAEKLGLKTPDSEVALAIGSEPGFSDNGVFDKRRYEAFVRQRGVDDQTFEEYLRQDLTMQKIRGLLDSVAWTTPSEIEQRLRNLTDERSIEYAIFDRSDFTVDVELTDAEIREFFDSHQDLFTIPERIQVRYVTFPYADQMQTNDIEEAVVAHYNDNIDGYTPDLTNQFEFPTPRPLDEVRPEIETMIRERAARLAAKDAANEFSYGLLPDRKGQGVSFEDAASETGLTVKVTQPFAKNEEVPELDVDARFNRVAFRLVANDPEFYFSDAVLASNAAFVIAFQDKQEAHLPEFENVREEISPLAYSNRLDSAFSDHVDAVREELVTSLSDDTSFSDVLARYDASVTTAVFSVYGSLVTNLFTHQADLVGELIDLQAGDLSKVVITDQEALIARIVEQTPSDPVESYALRGQLQRTLQQYRTGILYEDYADYLLRIAEFRDLQATPTDTPAEDDAGESAPAGSESR